MSDIKVRITDLQAISAGINPAYYSGHSPYIGQNGNWYTYDDNADAVIDTGVPAQGDEATRVASELERVAAELARSAAEEDRAAAEILRANAETLRSQAEEIRASTETTRSTAEAGRVTAETGRASAENERVSNETERQTDEAGREEAEVIRVASEEERVEAESVRASNEASRVNVEADRVRAESGRADTETIRTTSESQRIASEGERATAETLRQSAEATRGENETGRVAAETLRENAELARETAEAKREQNKAEMEIATAAIQGMTVGNTTLQPGSQATATVSDIEGHKHILFGIPRGDTGRSVVSIDKTSGTGLAGSVDVYTITYSDSSTSTFTVYNGHDGVGAGDMHSSIYDDNNDGKVNCSDVADSQNPNAQVAMSQVTGLATTLSGMVYFEETV